jgi:hypothetical protein
MRGKGVLNARFEIARERLRGETAIAGRGR